MKCTYIFLGTIFLFLLNSCGDTPQNPLKKILKDQSEHNYNYTIDNSKDTLLNTKDGLVLFIPQSCLTTKDGGPLTEAVTIEVSTFRDLTSILKEDLETISDDQLLISEGMFSIQAQTSSGQEIAINQDNPIQIIASLKYDNKDIMLFEEAQPNSSNWIAPQKPTGQSLVIPFETLWQNDVDIYNQGGTEIYTWIKEFYQDQCEDTTLCSFDLIKYQHSFIATNEFWTRYVADYYSGRDGFYQTSKSYRPNVTPWLSNSGSNLIDMYATQPVWAVDSFILEELKTNMNNLIKDSLNRLELHKQDVDNLDRRYIKLGSAPFTKAETANLVQLRIDDDQNYISNCREDIVIWENLKNQRLTQIDSSLLPAIDSNALRKIQKALEDEAKLSLMNRKSYAYLGSLSNKNTFNIKKFTTYNLDKFLKTELIPTQLTVKCNRSNPMVSLIFKTAKTIIQPTKQVDEQQLIFDRKLPQKTAFLIAISLDGDSPLFAKKEIKVGQNKVEELELKPSSQEEIVKDLQAIEQEY